MSRARLKYPPRFSTRPVRWEEEPQERMRRVCPGCFKPLRWLHYPKLIRMDSPTPSCELDEIVWVPETREYLVPRYTETSIPHCRVHGEVHWWLIFDTEKLLFVGLSSDHPTFWPERKNPETGKMERHEGGMLFRSPVRSTNLIALRWKRAASSRICGRWRLDQRNLRKPVLVVSQGEQLRLF